jgi:hypothetical protein
MQQDRLLSQLLESRWLQSHKERFLVCAGALAAASSPFADPFFRLLPLEEPWHTVAIVIGATALLIFTWLAYGVLANMASSLGYTEIPPTDGVQVSRKGNRASVGDDNSLIIPARLEFPALSEKYDGTDVLSPLESARLRLLDHIRKLRNNSVTNLFIGIGIAFVGVIILFSAILQIQQFFGKEKHIFDTNSFVFYALLPKLSVTLLVQIFSYFFLAMYRSNQNDIKYFQNEITLIDSLATAMIAAQRPGSAPNMKLVLAALSKNERNRVMKKSDKLIVTTDEAEFIRALSVLSQATNRSEKD